MSLWITLAQNVIPDTPAGVAGWAAFMTSGGVLAWLLFKHLPAKDIQIQAIITTKDSQILGLQETKDAAIRRLLDDQVKEREQERVSRHGLASQFQTALGEIHRVVQEESKESAKALQEESRLEREEFRQAMNVVLEHCQKESERVVEAFRSEISRMIAEGSRGRGGKTGV